MRQRIQLYPLFKSLFLATTCATILSGCVTPGKIVPGSQVSATNQSELTNALIIVIRSDRKKEDKFDADAGIELKRISVSYLLRDKLISSGIIASSIDIKKTELNPANTIELAIATQTPTHLLSVSIPKASFRDNVPFPHKYEVEVQLTEVKSRAIIWKYSADVEVGKEASTDKLVGSIISAMRNDRILVKQ